MAISLRTVSILTGLCLVAGAAFAARNAAMEQEAAQPPPPQTGFLFESIEVDGRTYDYAVYVPRQYDASEEWPVVMYLHGKGESGTDGQAQLRIGLPAAILTRRSDWPAIVVMPQKPEAGDQWEDHEAAVMAMLERAEAEYNLDPSRRYLTGLSQGGHGTMVLGARHADKWAAIAPICGYCDPEPLAPKLTKMPMWVFHGAEDPVVPVAQSERFVAAVTAAGGEAKLTIYPDTMHNSWDKAYAEPGFAQWLFDQRRD